MAAPRFGRQTPTSSVVLPYTNTLGEEAIELYRQTGMNDPLNSEGRSTKIDGAVAMIMGLDRAIRCGNDTSESVYDSRGLLVF